jgi:hypothetical protein
MDAAIGRFRRVAPARLINVANPDFRALACQPARGCKPNSGCAAGNNGALTRKAHILILICLAPA